MTKLAAKPWNAWRGLQEGDMCEELAELDTALRPPERRYGGEYKIALVGYLELAKNQPEALRKLWWDAIGRHDTN